MASSGNFCTLSPLDRSEYGTAPSLTSGNLRFQTTGSGPGNNDATRGTMATPTTGKWYFEFVDVQQYTVVGMQEINPNGVRKWNTNGYPVTQSGISQFFVFPNAGNSNVNNSSTNSFTAFTDGDIGGIAVDLDNGAFYLHNAGTYVNSGDPTSGSSKTGSLGNITTGTEYIPITCNHSYGSDTRMYFNFGQDSTFQGYTTAGGNADENGFGDFKYAPPSGYLALCSANLPISADIDPAQTDDDYPQKQFNAVAYDSTGSGQSITGVGFQPDLVWIKCRSDAQGNGLFDSTRGTSKVLQSNDTNAENTSSGVTSFDSDGYTMGEFYNQSGRQFVSWNWRANGGTTASNTDGSITSTVQANTKAGFSIITFTGTGSNATIGHGLSAKPDFFVVKSRSGGTGRNWAVYHSTQGATKYAELDNNNPFYTSSLRWNDTEPTDSLISLGTTGSVNASGENFVCYAWHDVEGFQKFGSYEGNGNDDGPFIYTGFRPRYWFFKEIDAADDWVAYDTARDTANTGSSKVLRYDSTAAEFDGTSRAVDVLSNGLKIRTSNGTINLSGNTYIFGAWGDVPFKYNNTF